MPTEHAALIQRTGFPVPAGGDLTDAERGLLARYGYWLEALAKGDLAPVTPEQRQFVQVARGEAAARSAFEVAWEKYRRAAAAPPPVGPLELADRFARLQAARHVAEATRDEYTARRAVILEQVRAQLDAVDAEFAEQLATTAEAVTRLEEEAREAALAFGASFRHDGVHAVFARGRVSWDAQKLAQYAEAHPEVTEYRRVGAPTVSLRYEAPK